MDLTPAPPPSPVPPRRLRSREWKVHRAATRAERAEDHAELQRMLPCKSNPEILAALKNWERQQQAKNRTKPATDIIAHERKVAIGRRAKREHAARIREKAALDFVVRDRARKERRS